MQKKAINYAHLFPDSILMKFITESNAIEGEVTLPERTPLDAIKKFLNSDITEQSILELHNAISEGRDILRGCYRKCQVRVGNYYPPPAIEVGNRMRDYFRKLEYFNSYRAHNEFELIHPFEDMNGRMGRYIWLNIALREGYCFQLGFLHKYYYQTLDKLEKDL